MPETQPETQPETEPVQPRFQCRHIHASGHRCASPSLRRETFCYFHHTTRKPISQQDLADRRGHQASFRLPPTEDRTAIQLAIDEVLRRIAAHDLDLKRAGLLLYGLQIASSNLPKPMQTKAQPAHPPAGTVEEIVLDEAHGPLAPIAEFQSAPHEKSLSEILLEQWAKDEADEAAAAARAAARAAAEDTEAAQAAEDAAEAAPPPEDWDDPRPLTIQAAAAHNIQIRAQFIRPCPARRAGHPQTQPQFRRSKANFNVLKILRRANAPTRSPKPSSGS